MTTAIIAVGVAAAVAMPTGERVHRTGLEFGPEDVDARMHGVGCEADGYQQ